MELFRLFGTIAINNDKANREIDDTTEKAEKSQGKISGAFGKIGTAALKVGAAVGAAAVTAGTAITKMAVSAYADYEQLVGGVDTLFKESSAKVQAYANNAYKTAGLSANEYMETVTSFSASLLQSLGGDTAKAADAANVAITDMADNANKMGTSMEMVQNAYQGFAKQNYTMLDNLKLGYGGTKEEMQRLLKDAQKLSGVKYDMSNLNDVYQAIHVIQTELGITGTTAKEASATISGSFASMKSAWQNLLVGIADGNQNLDQLFVNLWDGIVTVGENVIPRIGTTFQSLGKLITKIIPQTIQGASTTLLKSGKDMLDKIGDGIKQNVPSLIGKGLDMVVKFSENVRANAPNLISSGLQLIVQLAKGVMDGLPQMIEKVPVIISNFANVINDNMPTVLKAGVQIIITIGKGLIQAIPTLVKNIPKIISAVVDVFTAFQWLNLGKSLMVKLKDGIIAAGGAVKSAAIKIKDAVVKPIKELASNMLSLGTNLVKGLWNGIGNAKAWILSKIKGFGQSILNEMKAFFGIHSPSYVMEDEVGKPIAQGVAEGIRKNTKYAKKSAAELAEIILDAAKEKLETYKTYNNMTLASEVAFWDEIRTQCKEGTEGRLEADKAYFEAKKSLDEQLQAAEDEYQAKLEETNKKIQDRTNAILNSFSLFEEYVSGDPTDGNALTSSLQSQVDALEEWAGEINRLGSRIGDSDVFTAIQAMGVNALEQVKALNAMSSEEMQKYVALYDKRQSLAQMQAEWELDGEIIRDVEAAWNTYAETLEGLGVQAQKTGKETMEVMENITMLWSKNLYGIHDVTREKFKEITSTIDSELSKQLQSVRSAVTEMRELMASVGGSEVGSLTSPTIFGAAGSTSIGGETGILLAILEAIQNKSTTIYLNSKEISKAVNKDLGVIY